MADRSSDRVLHVPGMAALLGISTSAVWASINRTDETRLPARRINKKTAIIGEEALKNWAGIGTGKKGRSSKNPDSVSPFQKTLPVEAGPVVDSPLPVPVPVTNPVVIDPACVYPWFEWGHIPDSWRTTTLIGTNSSVAMPAHLVLPTDNIVIVSRHPGAIEWLRRRGIIGNVFARAMDSDIAGKIVYGILPLDKATLCKEVYYLRVPSLRGHQWDELSADQLEELGAGLVHIRAERLGHYELVDACTNEVVCGN